MFTKPLYYAHSAQDELGNLLPYEHWQTLQSHSVNVGEMAAEFARVFGAQEIACQTGQLHDLGKYSEAFNHRLHGGPSVDHATAGAKIAVERWGNVIGKLMAFCIAGHHAGLANGNGEGDNRRTLKQRLALQFGADIPALDNNQAPRNPVCTATQSQRASSFFLLRFLHTNALFLLGRCRLS